MILDLTDEKMMINSEPLPVYMCVFLLQALVSECLRMNMRKAQV